MSDRGIDTADGPQRIKEDRGRDGDDSRDEPVLVACPDARPPAYQAVVGLDRAGLLRRVRDRELLQPRRPPGPLARRLAPDRFARIERLLAPPPRPRDSRPIASARIPASTWRCGWRPDGRHSRPRLKRAVARWRTDRFDDRLARIVERRGPGALLVFSDVGSEPTLPFCRRLGIPTILSMVHGDVREERAGPRGRRPSRRPTSCRSIWATACSIATSWTGCTSAGSATSSWPIASLVPSEHIAATLVRHGTPRDGPRHPLRRRLPALPPACRQAVTTRPARSCSPAGSPSARGSSTCSRRGGGSAGPAGGSSSWVPCPASSVRSRPYLERSSPWDGSRHSRDARPDGGGRRLRVPVALRGLGRRDLRGAGVRLAQRGHAQRRLGRPRRHRRLPGRPARRRGPGRADGTARQRSASCGSGWPAPPAPGPWRSTGLATTPRSSRWSRN